MTETASLTYKIQSTPKNTPVCEPNITPPNTPAKPNTPANEKIPQEPTSDAESIRYNQTPQFLKKIIGNDRISDNTSIRRVSDNTSIRRISDPIETSTKRIPSFNSFNKPTTPSIHSVLESFNELRNSPTHSLNESSPSITGTPGGKKFPTLKREVLVGTPIKKGHPNYLLMYDMLTGIRISVSRCNSKSYREVEMGDFGVAHKLAFDETGKELTPKSGYDFKFKDYSPWVFKHVRDIFHVEPIEYLKSLTGKYVLSELGSPGKSGSFFYFSSDYRFIIKTIHHSEHKFIKKILNQYYTHVKENPHTLLSRIFGLHRVKLPGNKKIHFVVMGNVFPPNKDIHETFDLKGSRIGRGISDEEVKDNPLAVMKDLNWLGLGRKLEFGEIKKKVLMDQIEKDVSYLQRNKIMDYSLLIGIHDLIRGNKEKLREKSLSVYKVNPDTTTEPPKKPRSKTKKPSFHSRTQSELISLPDSLPNERRHAIFYQDNGGFQSTYADNEPGHVLYYLGIIDIFTEYTMKKRIEHFIRGVQYNGRDVSAVEPGYYGERFLRFIEGVVEAKQKIGN